MGTNIDTRDPRGHRITANAAHGSPYTYARGCRCRDGEHGAIGCTTAWRNYRRAKNAERRVRMKREADALGISSLRAYERWLRERRS